MIRRVTLAVLCGAALASCTRVDAPGAAATAAATARHGWTDPDTLRVGSGLVPRTLDPVLSTWTTLLANWLRVNGYLAAN